MKHMKSLSLLAVLLAAAMMLGSCGLFGGGEAEIGDILDGAAVYTPEADPASGAEVSALAGLSFNFATGDLLMFTSSEGGYTTYTVYNLKSGTVALELTNTQSTTYSVLIESVTYEGDDIGYIRVQKTTSDEDGERTVTRLCDASGNQIAEAKGSVEIHSCADLLYFDNAFYRASNGSITKKCDWSPLAVRPEPDMRAGDCYYEIDGKRIIVYRDDLTVLSDYKVPGYARSTYAPVILGNGDILLQYLVMLPKNSEEYTTLLNMDDEFSPVDIVTVIVDHEDGDAKEIDCDYLLLQSKSLDGAEATEYGIKSDRYRTLILGIKIEEQMNERMTQGAAFLLADEDGDIKVVEELMGATIGDIALFANGRWRVELADGRKYLIDAEGEVIGEVTEASFRGGKYFVCDGKVYDMSLRELLDYDEKDLALASLSSGNGVLYFRNDDGDFLSWNGSGEPAVVLSGDDEDKYFVGSYDWGYAISDSDAGTTTAYSASGAQLFSVSRTYAGIETFRSVDEAILVKTTNSDGDTVYYRLAK